MSDKPQDLDDAFFHACLANPPDRAELQRLLDAGANPNTTGEHELYGGISALMALILKREPDADPDDIRWLLDRGAAVDQATDDPSGRGTTALIFAASYGLPEVCDALLAHGADPNAASSSYDKPTPLMTSIIGLITPEREATQRILLEAGADPNWWGPQGQSALLHACRRDDHVALGLLLDHGGDPLGCSPNGELYNRESPMTAVVSGAVRPRCLALLLERGADPNTLDARGSLALRGAAFTGVLDAIQALLDHGADLNRRDTSGQTALRSLVAWAWCKAEVVEALLDRGADPDLPDDKGVTPLMAAVGIKRLDVVTLLLDAGADPRRADAEGRTALTRAEADGLDLIAAHLRGDTPHLDRNDPVGLAIGLLREGTPITTAAGGTLLVRNDRIEHQHPTHAWRNRPLTPEAAREHLAELTLADDPDLRATLDALLATVGLPPYPPGEPAALLARHHPDLAHRMTLLPSPRLAAEALLDTLDTGHELSRTDKEGSSGYRRRGDLYVDFYNEHQGGDSETVLSRDAMRDRLQAVYTDHATGGLEDTFTRGAYLREALAHLGFETLRLYGLSRASRG